MLLTKFEKPGTTLFTTLNPTTVVVVTVRLLTAPADVLDNVVKQVAAFAAPAARTACRAMALAPIKRGRVLAEGT